MGRGYASIALVVLVAACGLDAVGTGASSLPNAQPDAATPGGGDGGPSPGTPEGGPVDVDAAPAVVVPSHTSELFDPAAATLSGVTAIDTGALTITLAAAPTPTAPRFEDHDGVAVLYVGGWTVDQPVRITGARKLIVLASGAVKIDAAVDAGAKGATPGPGGSAPGAGPGAGGSGEHKGADDSSGGGGGGFGAAGAKGANVSTAMGGAAGVAYGGLVTDFFGGAGGGKGGDACPADFGGAGGGAVQISSQVSITIAGGINAGGGGGSGGCSYVSSAESAAGAGGGAGGLIFLEAPQVTVTATGVLSANGGGGGTGSYYNGSVDGVAGADATGVGVAAGGSKAQTSPGGAGATGSSPPVTPGSVTANNGGGGGGGVGRIWLRTRSAPAVVQPGAGVSPAAATDTTL